MNESFLLTPIGMLNYGHSYWTSARSLQKTQRDCTHPDAPVDFLFFHAIELLLKSYLLSTGVAIKDIKTHNFEKLFEYAMENGLKVTKFGITAFCEIADLYIHSRYISNRFGPVADHELLHELCVELWAQVDPVVRKGAGITRALQQPT
ncbi:HEPN domain-containing protein [Pannonibacter carbonis]|uniref:HEPN domain-containing protein n=1 Tax=Pannonibacter carbonis TaxID=2067569 RepID=UPI000D527376|nr:HEPN domain-containing protein [Pannonibacter carbonis]